VAAAGPRPRAFRFPLRLPMVTSVRSILVLPSQVSKEILGRERLALSPSAPLAGGEAAFAGDFPHVSGVASLDPHSGRDLSLVSGVSRGFT
jgi:hypothetical protein